MTTKGTLRLSCKLRMEPDKIDYFEGGEDYRFLEIGVRDKKIQLLLNFLNKTDVEFKVINCNEGKVIELENNIQCVFYDSGRICFELNEECADKSS